ncbi:hypothetical protein [Agromyces sp. NPDC057865]|uniref:hypothetical protein n=1 Tax=Agromyces sp. NPDC057865 TaxID=3346267 RepID=UPI00366EB468
MMIAEGAETVQDPITAFFLWASTPLGSAIVGGVVVAILVAIGVALRKQIAGAYRFLRSRHETRMRQKYGEPGPEPTRTTLAVSFVGLDTQPNKVSQYVELYSHDVLGGPMHFALSNLGPYEATDVSVELMTPSLHALTALAWDRISPEEARQFGVQVPLEASRNARLRWNQGEHVLVREIELPTGRGNTLKRVAIE